MDDRALNLVMEAGKTMLANGGEVFRAQDTMDIMARSLGVEDFNVYVLTNGIFASAQGGTVNAVRHIPSVNIHLGRVEAINALSRDVAAGRLDLEGAEAALAAAVALPPVRFEARLLSAAVGSGCFAFLFGGGGPEVCMALLAGFAESVLTHLIRLSGSSRIFSDILAAWLCTTLVLLGRIALPGLDANTAIIGALMVLTPGVALTMGIRDFINADYLSGTIRLFDAVLVAGCLACGVALAYLLAHLLLGVMP